MTTCEELLARARAFPVKEPAPDPATLSELEQRVYLLENARYSVHVKGRDTKPFRPEFLTLEDAKVEYRQLRGHVVGWNNWSTLRIYDHATNPPKDVTGEPSW